VKIVPRNVIPVPTNKIFVKLARWIDRIIHLLALVWQVILVTLIRIVKVSKLSIFQFRMWFLMRKMFWNVWYVSIMLRRSAVTYFLPLSWAEIRRWN
jgi:hypothetical protein